MIKKILYSIFIIITMVSCVSNSDTIKIGAKNFTESLVVSEIYAQALEKEDIKVERVFNIAGNLIHNAIVNKEIDLYPEYTGTALITILKEKAITDPKKVYDIVKKEYDDKYKIKWLELTKANDSNGIAIRTSVANKYNIFTLSDLQKNSDKIRFASQGEFHIREDALPALEKVYGKFNFKSFKVYSNELKYRVLDEDKADATIVYTTEGNLSRKDKYIVLKDDKFAFPPYHMVAIVRNEILDKFSNVEKILNNIDSKLNSDVLIKLNSMVDINGMSYQEVARKFLNGSINE